MTTCCNKVLSTAIFTSTILLTGLVLQGCGPDISESKKNILLRAEESYRSAGEDNFLEKQTYARRLSKQHWDESKRKLWADRASEAARGWKEKNPNSEFDSALEEDLNKELKRSTRIDFNNYGMFAYRYRELYEITGKEEYLDPKIKFEGLSEFRHTTQQICRPYQPTAESIFWRVTSADQEKLQSVYAGSASFSMEDAERISKMALGLGACMCAMHDYFKVRDNFSIGFCLNAKYYTCSHPQVPKKPYPQEKAFCGDKGDREKLASIIGDYRYSVEPIDLPGEYAGQVSSDLLEFGKRQTEKLVQDYCATNPNC